MEQVRVPVDELRTFAAGLLRGHGVPADDASTCANRLVEGDLRGRRGHGVFRLPFYCDRIRAGGFNLKPTVVRERETPVSALVDGDNALGQVAMTYAVDTAIEKAKSVGMAWVGVRRGNHAGAAGVYTSLVARQGLIGVVLAVANTNQLPPWGGTDPLLGTNPISIAVPAGEEPPVVLDVATTVVSFGEVKVAANEGRPLPEGWMVDRSGEPLTDPTRVGDGFLLPIGGYKGYGLSLVIGLLAGVLNGARFGRDVIDHYQDLETPTDTGQCVLALRTDLFRDPAEFAADVDRHLRDLRDSDPMDPAQPIHFPGETAARREAEMRKSGVPIDVALLERLNSLAASVDAPNLSRPAAR